MEFEKPGEGRDDKSAISEVSFLIRGSLTVVVPVRKLIAQIHRITIVFRQQPRVDHLSVRHRYLRGTVYQQEDLEAVASVPPRRRVASSPCTTETLG